MANQWGGVLKYKLSEKEAGILAADRNMADFFEEVVGKGIDAKPVSNWILGDFSRLLNENRLEIKKSKITPDNLAGLIALIQDSTISGKIAKTVFEEMFQSGQAAGEIVDQKGLKQVSDEGQITEICQQVLDANPTQVEEYKQGKQKVLGFFVGQIMKQTKGKANPQLVNKTLMDILS